MVMSDHRSDLGYGKSSKTTKKLAKVLGKVLKVNTRRYGGWI